MQKTRRIGSITLGITLVVCGVLFLIRTFFPEFNCIMFVKFWPVTFIILGIEVLFDNLAAGRVDTEYKYDFPAILMMVATGMFAMSMAVLEAIIEHGMGKIIL